MVVTLTVVADGAAAGDCPVGAVLAAAAARLSDPVLARMAAGLAEPVRVGVRGRPGAGRRTVARALRGAGIALAAGPADIEVAGGPGAGPADIEVYVAVETLTPEDRAALAGPGPAGVAVLTKADLSGFGGAGPMAAAAARCAALRRETGVPLLPLAGLAAAAALDPAGLDDDLLGAVRSVAAGRSPAGTRRLLAELDLFGVAHAVRAVHGGAGRAGVAAALRRASGVDAVLAGIDRAAAAVRYRRAGLAVAGLAGPAAARPAVAGLLAGDALARARMTLALEVLAAAGLPAAGPGDPLRAAVGWRRYARGPVNDLHRSCAEDAVRGLLRQWSGESVSGRC